MFNFDLPLSSKCMIISPQKIENSIFIGFAKFLNYLEILILLLDEHSR